MRHAGRLRGVLLAALVAALAEACANGGGDAGPSLMTEDDASASDASVDAREGAAPSPDGANLVETGTGEDSTGPEAASEAGSGGDDGPTADAPVESGGGREAGTDAHDPDADADAGCTKDSQCPLGEVCDGQGSCTPGCDPMHGCPSGESCCGTKCIASTACCASTDCTSPPAPTACYPAEGTCGTGGTCSYTPNPGAVVCSASECCNPIHGTCKKDCSLACAGGWGHCTGDASKGCETDLDTSTGDCGACGRSCSGSEVRGLSCANGLCDSTCQKGWGNCHEPAAPAVDDGCESDLTSCVGTPCCAAGVCQGHHVNGLGDKYDDCALFGVPGKASTYTVTMAKEARTAWGQTGNLRNGTCNDGSGGTSSCVALAGPPNAVWCYTGKLAGYAHESTGTNLLCPTTASRTWD